MSAVNGTASGFLACDVAVCHDSLVTVISTRCNIVEQRRANARLSFRLGEKAFRPSVGGFVPCIRACLRLVVIADIPTTRLQMGF